MYNIRKGKRENDKSIRFEESENVTEDYATIAYAGEDKEGGECLIISNDSDSSEILVSPESVEYLIMTLQKVLEEEWFVEEEDI